jgi:hypothetical protein
VSPVELTDGRRRVEYESYDRGKAWSSIYISILSGLVIEKIPENFSSLNIPVRQFQALVPGQGRISQPDLNSKVWLDKFLCNYLLEKAGPPPLFACIGTIFEISPSKALYQDWPNAKT